MEASPLKFTYMGVLYGEQNQPINLAKNQIMKCFICDNELMGSKNLSLCTRWWKGLIIYHKSNGIMAMKKHIEVEHNTLLKKHSKGGTIHPHRSPLDCQLANKWPHVLLNFKCNFWIFLFYKSIQER